MQSGPILADELRTAHGAVLNRIAAAPAVLDDPVAVLQIRDAILIEWIETIPARVDNIGLKNVETRRRRGPRLRGDAVATRSAATSVATPSPSRTKPLLRGQPARASTCKWYSGPTASSSRRTTSGRRHSQHCALLRRPSERISSNTTCGGGQLYRFFVTKRDNNYGRDGVAQFKIKSVPVQNVYLDNDNPRHDPIDNEKQIIELLLKKESVRPLAEDIAEMGLSPLERMAVIAHPKVKGAFVAIEGNRRLCSIKLLLDPEKAPSAADRKAFTQARAKMQALPKTIEVAEFADRDSGRHWLRLRHGGEQEGRGTRRWSAGQKARFENQGAGASPNQQALQLIDYARHRNLITPEEADSLAITTLTRYLSNPSFREALALDDHKGLNVRAPQEEFDRAAQRFLRDSLNGEVTGVNSRSNSQKRKEYADQLRREKVATSTRLEAPIELDPTTGGAVGEPAATRVKRERDNRHPDTRKFVIPSSFSAKMKDKIFQRIYGELKTVNADTHTFAAAYLFRAFMEQLAKAYLKKHGGLVVADKLHQRIGKMAAHLESATVATSHQLKPFKRMANQPNSDGSPETLGSFVHGGDIPTKSVINRSWDSCEPLISLALGTLK